MTSKDRQRELERARYERVQARLAQQQATASKRNKITALAAAVAVVGIGVTVALGDPQRRRRQEEPGRRELHAVQLRADQRGIPHLLRAGRQPQLQCEKVGLPEGRPRPPRTSACRSSTRPGGQAVHRPLHSQGLSPSRR